MLSRLRHEIATKKSPANVPDRGFQQRPARVRPATLAGLAGLLSLVVAAGPARALELTTYGYGNARTSASPGHVGISPGAATRLRTAWVAHLHGAITGQALVLNAVRAGRHRHNIVLAGTEHGQVAAVDAVTGRILWSRRLVHYHLTPSCQASPDGVFGITGTMVADAKAGRVYAVDVSGRAWALRLDSGRTVRGWPVRVHPGGGDFVWGALALSHGRLYVPIASLCDRGNYQGGVRAIDLSNPRHIIRWVTTGKTHAYGGGVWGWGGLSIDGRTGDVFIASGNALGTAHENAGYAENVVRLSPKLAVEQHNYPLRHPFQIGDRDFGTVPVLIHARGCPDEAVAINKDGHLYVYDTDDISRGPRQSIRVADSTAATIPLYGMPAFDPKTRRLVLVSPTSPPGGSLHAGVQSFVLTARCRFAQSWQRGFDAPDAGGPPTIAEGVVYIGTGRNGVLRAFRLSDGHQLWGHARGASIFAAPSVADGAVYFGDWGGNLWALRPRR